MISSATLFLATLALHFTVVLGAPISIPVAEIAPRSLGDSGFSVRFARDESFPEVVPTFVKRAITDVFPIVKRETEDIVRRFPRRFIYDHLEKRGTTIQEKVTVIEKTIKHDNPADTVAYNNGQPQNSNNDGTGNDNGATGGFTTSIGFSTTIAIPGVPTPTPTSTSSSSTAPTPVPTDAPAPAPPAANGGTPDAPATPSGTTTATDAGNTAAPTPTPAPAPAPPAANGGTPDAPATPSGTTTATDAGNTAAPTPDAPKPDAPKPDAPASPDGTTTTTTDGGPKPSGTTTTDGSTPAAPKPDAPATPSPDGTTTTTTTTGEDPSATGGEQKPPTDGLVQPDASTTPVTKRKLAMSGAVLASSLRRRAL